MRLRLLFCLKGYYNGGGMAPGRAPQGQGCQGKPRTLLDQKTIAAGNTPQRVADHRHVPHRDPRSFHHYSVNRHAIDGGFVASKSPSLTGKRGLSLARKVILSQSRPISSDRGSPETRAMPRPPCLWGGSFKWTCPRTQS